MLSPPSPVWFTLTFLYSRYVVVRLFGLALLCGRRTGHGRTPPDSRILDGARLPSPALLGKSLPPGLTWGWPKAGWGVGGGCRDGSRIARTSPRTWSEPSLLSAPHPAFGPPSPLCGEGVLAARSSMRGEPRSGAAHPAHIGARLFPMEEGTRRTSRHGQVRAQCLRKTINIGIAICPAPTLLVLFSHPLPRVVCNRV